MRAPRFWIDDNTLSSALLPAARLYGWASRRRREAAQPVTLPVPVVCVGNAVAGGAGKTPVALAIGAMLREQGVQAHFLTRGYRGRLAGPVQVSHVRHTAADVGDEALLLARMLPCWVARDRVAGGKAAVAAGAEIIIMDDGYQNESLHKTVSLLVLDGPYGVGNGRLLPAGPLREPFADAAARATAIVLYGDDRQDLLRRVSPYKPVLQALLAPSAGAQVLRGRKVVAFAGIGLPEKFYRTLEELDCEICHRQDFPDHHWYGEGEVRALQEEARRHSARLVTTAKDYVRLPPQMRPGVFPVPVEAVFEDPDALWRLIFP